MHKPCATFSSEEASDDTEIGVEMSIIHQYTKTFAQRYRCLILASAVAGLLVVGISVGLVAISHHNSSSKKTKSSTEAASSGFDFSGVMAPSESVGINPSINGSPSKTPTSAVSVVPSKIPSTKPSPKPTFYPSSKPTTAYPTHYPTKFPTFHPTPSVPTPSPTYMPASKGPTTPINSASSTLLTFCAIADVPYNASDAAELPKQISAQMDGCEFLVHLGDIMNGETACRESRYTDLKDILMQSLVPVFIVVGDNEWNDCGSDSEIIKGRAYWDQHLLNLQNNWISASQFKITACPDYQESFYFVWKRTLIFGLFITGGRVQNLTEWNSRLSIQAEWVKEVIRQEVPTNAAGVIMMAHAKPTDHHKAFFSPIKNFIEYELLNEIPFLYFHGDGHKWVYKPKFMGQPNFLGIQHEGGVRNPILKILADPEHLGPEVFDSVAHIR